MEYLSKFTLLVLLWSLCETKANLVLSNGKSYPAVSIGFPRHQPDPSAVLESFLVLADPADGCSPLTNNVRNMIVVIQGEKCFPSVKARNAQNAGALATIVFTFGSSFGGTKFIQSSSNENDVVIPSYEISTSHRDEIVASIQTNPNITGKIFADLNPKDVIFSNGFWIFFAAANGLVNFAVMILAAYRLTFYIVNKIFNPASVTHVLIFGGCIARIIYVIDFHGYYGFIRYVERTFFTAMSLVLTICAAVAIGFFWLEVFNKGNLETKISFMQRYKLLTVIILILISLLSLAITILTSSLINIGAIGLIGLGIYGLVTFVIFIFFIYCCHAIKNYLNVRLENNVSKIAQVMKKLFILGIVQSVCIGLYFILAAILAVPTDSEILSSVLSSLLTIDSSVLAVVQIFMFSNQKKTQTSNDNVSSKSAFSQQECPMEEKNIEDPDSIQLPSSSDIKCDVETSA